MDMAIDVRQAVAFAQRSRNAANIVRQELTSALEKSGRAVEGTAKELAPINEGFLRDSIAPHLQYPNMIVSAQKEYAPVMEYGREAGKPMPPDEPIRYWLQRKRMLTGDEAADNSLVWRVRMGISKNGIKGRFYMKRSFEQNQNRIRQFFDLAGASIRRRALAE